MRSSSYPRGSHLMHALESRVPPPVVGLLVAAAMWCLSLLPPSIQQPSITRGVLAVGLAAVGAAFSLSGVLAFRRARTTVNPLKPASATSLVSGGIYRVTRNPMYVGMLFLLFAWATLLWSIWSLLGTLLFVGYITRFQITPEERALAALFGAEFAAYKSRVRQWL